MLMEPSELSPLLEPLLGKIVIVDLSSSYVCLGTFVACDAQFLAWFKNARFWVTLEISARTSIGPALERVYANPG